MGGNFSQNFQDLYGLAIPVKENLKIGGWPQIWAWGGANFLIGPRSVPSGHETVLCRPAGFVQLLGNRLPYIIYPPWAKPPETFSPKAGQTRLSFWKIRFFFDFWGGALPGGRSMGAISRVRSVVLRMDNKLSKFQPPEILSSRDIGHQTWHRVIWPENRRKKTKSRNTPPAVRPW